MGEQGELPMASFRRFTIYSAICFQHVFCRRFQASDRDQFSLLGLDQPLRCWSWGFRRLAVQRQSQFQLGERAGAPGFRVGAR